MSPSHKEGRNDSNRLFKRRSFIKSSAALATASSAALAGCQGTGGDGSGGDEIVLGDLSPRTGAMSVYGTPMSNAAELAVQEINNDGGLLGREVVLESPDPQSDPQVSQDTVSRLIQQENVDALFGMVSSANRESILPIVNENSQLYFYPALYEGGVCNEYTFITGPIPNQNVMPLVEYMINEFGPDCYLLAADYEFGQISAQWVQRGLGEYGGNTVGEEFFPLDVSDFSSTINNIQQEDPDWIYSLLVGGPHASFFGQAESAGIDYPMGSSVQVGSSYEHKTLEPPQLSNLYASFDYFEELDTEQNQAFVDKFYEQYPDTQYINQQAYGQYIAYKLYASAVEEAGTVEQSEVGSALESGISIDGPAGNWEMDPATHHLVNSAHITKVEEDHSLTFIDTIESREPSGFDGECNLDSESTWEDPVTTNILPE
jgi:branched-chain amino acid transport system substrate-binding protein